MALRLTVKGEPSWDQSDYVPENNYTPSKIEDGLRAIIIVSWVISAMLGAVLYSIVSLFIKF
jgi:hypothetical protein